MEQRKIAVLQGRSKPGRVKLPKRLCHPQPNSNGGTSTTSRLIADETATIKTYDFDKLIWQLASPKWKFDSATFDRSAAAFDNPDHVAIVIHNYRWRLGLAEGESKYDDLENRLAQAPVIAVPTITLEGDANGAPHPDPSSYAKKFVGK